MKMFQLRNIPDPLWREVKTLAAHRGHNIREVIVAAIEAYIDREQVTLRPRRQSEPEEGGEG